MLSLLSLGQLSLQRDGAPIPGFDSQRQGLALLVILGAEGAVSRDRLMTLLWPESDTSRARGSLKQALHQLRRLLGTPDLLQGQSILSLNPAEIETDVGRFVTALDRRDFAGALDLYAGPFLDGVHLAGSGEFEIWVEDRRADLARRRAGALEQLATDAESQGEPLAAAEYWSRLQQQQPADGRATLRLMLALEAAGRRAGALQQARNHERLLRDEWGLAPDPGVMGLAERLRAAPPAAGPGVVSPFPGKAGVAPAPAAGDSPDLGPASARATRGRGVKESLLAAAALLVMVLGATAIRGLRGDPMAAGDPNLVAVAPFQVLDSSLVLWHEGMADMLARDLDGAGPLRTVPAATAFRRWRGGTDRASAAALGERTGAALVVFGSVVRLDPDSVALRASVLDRSANRLAAELEVRGPEESIGRLADSLVVETLRALGHGRPIGAARRVSLAARSMPVLRQFLRGEQFYRRGAWDSALVHYDQAVAADSGFGLALRRMYQSITWGAVTGGRYRGQREYRTRAFAHARGLGSRDSLLFLADSLRFASESTNDPPAALRDLRRTLAVLEAALGKYPDDVELWYELGELRYHSPPPFGWAAAPALEAFERAIALDPGFAPVYAHAVELAVQQRRPAHAARYARTGAALAPGLDGSRLGLAALVFDSGIGSPVVTRALSTQPGNGLLQLGGYFRWATDSGETTIVALGSLREGRRENELGGALIRDSLARARNLARALAFRGRLEEAARLAGDRARPAAGGIVSAAAVDPFLELALFGAVADSVAQQVFSSALAPDADWGAHPYPMPPREFRGAAWWLARRDTTALKRLAARASLAARQHGSPMAEFRGSYLESVARAYLTLARGDSAEAARMLGAVPDSLCIVTACPHEKFTLARLLAAQGETQAAADLLDRWTLVGETTPSAVLAALERARLAVQLGDTAGARERYRFVTEVWRRADPALQPYVAEARQALAKMGGQ